MVSVPTVGSMLAVIAVTLLGVAVVSAAIGALLTRAPKPAPQPVQVRPAHRVAVPGQRGAGHDREDARV